MQEQQQGAVPQLQKSIQTLYYLFDSGLRNTVTLNSFILLIDAPTPDFPTGRATIVFSPDFRVTVTNNTFVYKADVGQYQINDTAGHHYRVFFPFATEPAAITTFERILATFGDFHSSSISTATAEMDVALPEAPAATFTTTTTAFVTATATNTVATLATTEIGGTVPPAAGKSLPAPPIALPRGRPMPPPPPPTVSASAALATPPPTWVPAAGLDVTSDTDPTPLEWVRVIGAAVGAGFRETCAVVGSGLKEVLAPSPTPTRAAPAAPAAAPPPPPDSVYKTDSAHAATPPAAAFAAPPPPADPLAGANDLPDEKAEQGTSIPGSHVVRVARDVTGAAAKGTGMVIQEVVQVTKQLARDLGLKAPPPPTNGSLTLSNILHATASSALDALRGFADGVDLLVDAGQSVAVQHIGKQSVDPPAAHLPCRSLRR
ncbi:hypothetical protein PAPYR_4534 [Paratrimastix pyriformis]|uniref:Senescence domain-containing protein n=1 Tax=Paratrimastix pyriformis TaxID=342808 RepID=A0ABQ8UQ63_9EUKA|nr:hypothetical protein PAPYR_4534 [Paratrimastix pyriformis]